MGHLTLEMILEEILALYQEVHWLGREPGEVQFTEDIARKAHNEILEAIRTHLQCRWSSSQLTEPRQIPRMLGEAQYHPYMHPSCDHFDFNQARREALRETRETHCWAWLLWPCSKDTLSPSISLLCVVNNEAMNGLSVTHAQVVNNRATNGL